MLSEIYNDEELKEFYLAEAKEIKRQVNKMKMKLFFKEKFYDQIANQNYRLKMKAQMDDYRADIDDLQDEEKSFRYAAAHLDGTSKSVRDARQKIRMLAKELGLNIAPRKGYQIIMSF